MPRLFDLVRAAGGSGATDDWFAPQGAPGGGGDVDFGNVTFRDPGGLPSYPGGGRAPVNTAPGSAAPRPIYSGGAPGGGALPRGADMPTTTRDGEWEVTSGGVTGAMTRRNRRTGETQSYNRQTGQWVSGPLVQQGPGGGWGHHSPGQTPGWGPQVTPDPQGRAFQRLSELMQMASGGGGEPFGDKGLGLPSGAKPTGWPGEYGLGGQILGGAGLGNGGMVWLRAPDGTTQAVPASQVAHYQARGAQIVG